MNYFEYFRSATKPFFIACTPAPSTDGPVTNLTITVCKGEPLELTFDELWGEFEVVPERVADSVTTAIRAVNVLRNSIAARSRRVFGNLLFTADAEFIELLKTQHGSQDITYVHAPELPVGELRMALFSSKNSAIEGGIAWHDGQLYAHEGYLNYFARMVL
jgi:hypothetical protein